MAEAVNNVKAVQLFQSRWDNAGTNNNRNRKNSVFSNFVSLG